MVKDGSPIPVRFPSGDEKRLRIYALESGITMSEAVRQMIDLGFAQPETGPSKRAKRCAEPKPRIYFIRCAVPSPNGGMDSRVKIGFTTNDPRRRIVSFETGNPFPLTLLFTEPGGAEDERRLHERFMKYRLIDNREWFCEVGELAQYIAERQRSRKTKP